MYLSVMNGGFRVLLLIAICTMLYSFNKKPGCTGFRTGQYTSNYLKHRGVLAVYNRTSDSTQEETATFPNGFTYSAQYKVTWYSDCHYVLYQLSTTIDEADQVMVNGDSIDVVIQKIIADNKIQIQSNFKGWLLTDTLTKLD